MQLHQHRTETYLKAINGTEALRFTALKAMSLIVAIFSFAIAIINIRMIDQLDTNQAAFIIQLEFLNSSIYAILYLRLRAIGRAFNIDKLLFSYTYIGITLYLLAIFNPNFGLVYWTFLYPFILFFLFDLRHASIASLLLLPIAIFTQSLAFKDSDPLFSLIMINYVPAYLSITIISGIYQYSRSKIQDTMTEIATLDPLTGVRNRLSLLQEFEKIRNMIPQLNLAIMSLDFFRSINERHGYKAGDTALLHFVNALQAATPHHRIFRLSSNEFCLLIDGSPEKAQEALLNVQNNISTVKILGAKESFSVSFSAGMTNISPEVTLKSALKAADDSLKQVTSVGGNSIHINIRKQAI